MSKMGISTIQSYRGAQIFEAVGLRQDVIDKYFTWTPSRIGGIGLDVIAQEVLMRHHAAFPTAVNGHVLPSGGQYQWRNDGEYHLFNPESIHRLQKAVRTGSFDGVQGVREAWSTTSPQTLHAARPAGIQALDPGPDRGGRAGRERS
jgi:glutamate synthase domain-containing protein 2